MLINKVTKQFMSRSDKPNENWLNDDNYFVVPDESELYYKIIEYSNKEFELKIEDGKLADVELPREVEIKKELNELDNTINRATEDLYTLTKTTPYETIQEVINKKEELRSELKELKKNKK